MKTITKIFIGLGFLALVAAALPWTNANATQFNVDEKVVGVNDAFIPGGFDSSSDAYVVVSGLFPNGCYSFNRATVNRNVADKTHEVRVVANVTEGLCIAVLVPYSQEVRLGRLDRGDHKVRFMNGDGTYMEKTMTIQE